jgi:hypothetical protein
MVASYGAFAAQAVSPEHHAVPLPAGALLSALWVNTELVFNDGTRVTNNSFPEENHWNATYRTNMQPNNGAQTGFEHVLFGDRRHITQDTGIYAHSINTLPAVLVGAHYFQMPIETRNRLPAPYIVLTAAQDIYVYWGLSQRTTLANQEIMLTPEWQPTGLFLESHDTTDAQNQFDESPAANAAAAPGGRMQYRYYLYVRLVRAGETIEFDRTVQPHVLAFVPVPAAPEVPAATPVPTAPPANQGGGTTGGTTGGTAGGNVSNQGTGDANTANAVLAVFVSAILAAAFIARKRYAKNN